MNRYKMSQEKETCNVCTETYTLSIRRRISCSGCEFHSCKECSKRYLLSQSKESHCMSCKQKWTLDFMFENFGRGWVNKDYKSHKKELLFDIEKSKIPATMPRVEAYKEVEEVRNHQGELTKRIEELKLLLQITRTKRDNCYSKIYQLKSKPFSKPKEFKHHCAVDGCKGFLSKQWKCAVCATWACCKCHKIIGYKKDNPHTCKKEDIDSVEEIKKTTKPCPSCAVPIQKSVGCNQMWCTQCQVAFDWKSGEIQNGVIHNPHFFEAKRSGMIRAPGDNVCGGLPNYWDWDNIIKIYCEGLKLFDSKGENARNKRKMFDNQCAISYRTAGENVDYINNIRRQVISYNGPKMEELRIQYIMGIIDEKKYKSLISTQDNSREKRQANLDILEIYNTVTIENLQGFIGRIQDFFGMNISLIKINVISNQFQQCERDHLVGLLDEFNKNIVNIRDYVNKRAWKIGYYYNQSIHIVNERGGVETKQKVSKAQLDERMTYYKTKEDLNMSNDGGCGAAPSCSA